MAGWIKRKNLEAGPETEKTPLGRGQVMSGPEGCTHGTDQMGRGHCGEGD